MRKNHQMKKYLLLFLLHLTALPLLLKSQDSTQEKKPVFTATAAYQSYVHFLGRTDSLNSSAAMAITGYQLRNGLYAQGAVIFVNNNLTSFKLTGGSIELGYRFPETNHFSGNVFASRFIYGKQSLLVQSSLSYQTGINANFKTKIININTGADLKFSDHTDVGLTAGADHLFIIRLKENEAKALAINPGITAYAGTQRFSTTYQKNQSGNIIGIPVGNQPVTVTEQQSRLSILAYEATVPVILVLKKFNAFIFPSYIIPQNILTQAGEHGTNKFYITAGVGIRL